VKLINDRLNIRNRANQASRLPLSGRFYE